MTGLKSLLVAGALAAVCQGSTIPNQKPLQIQDIEQTILQFGHKGPAKPLVDTKFLQAQISSKNLLARAEKLYEIAKLSEDEYNHPTRVIGSKGHLGTLSYIWDTITSLGDYYTVTKQPFVAVQGHVYEAHLVIDNDVPASASPMSLTPPTKGKDAIFAELILVDNEGCNPSDFPASTKGKIALILRGTCPFGTKSGNAGKAGAVAAVVYNYEDGPVSGTLGTPSDDNVATFGLSGADAAPIVAKLKAGKEVDGSAYIDAVVNAITTSNIIAQTVAGDPENCVMLGGHSDSVGEGPGINDDGSGSISLLEVATALTKFSVNNCVRFAWWSAEEEGLLGSDHYVSTLTDEENRKIRLFMDYDMMASPNFAYQVYNATNAANPTGSEELRNLYVDWYEAHGLGYSFIPFDGRSDYDAFIRNGIPGGGIATGAEGLKTPEEAAKFGGTVGQWYDPCYHQLCDDVSNLNMTAFELNTKLIAHSVATYAASFKNFPARVDVAAAEAVAYQQQVKYHGSKLVM